jgi:hypothetical protein
LVRRATPATLIGVRGRPTRASAWDTRLLDAVGEKLPLANRTGRPMVAATAIFHRERVICFSFGDCFPFPYAVTVARDR